MASSRAACSSCPFSVLRVRKWPIRSRACSPSSAVTSRPIVSTPASTHSCAIPAPIAPSPTTPTLRISAIGGRSYLPRDLPDVAAGVAKAGGSDSPGTIDRAVEELDAPPGQLGAHRVDVFHLDRELKTRARLAIGYRGGL